MQSQSTCPNCGAPIQGNQRFCSECGRTIDVEAARPTVRSNEPAHTQYSATPPPPPPPTYPSSPGSSPQYGVPSGSFGNTPSSPSYDRLQQPPEGAYVPPVQQQQYQAPVPDFARAQPNAGRGVLRGLGCGMLAVVLVILAVLGGLGYGGYLLLSHAGKGSTTSNSHPTATAVTGNTPAAGNTPTASDTTPTPAPPQVVTLGTNMSLTYSTIQLTFTQVQQAQSFPDDGSSNGNPSTVRINFKEANTTSHGVYYGYADVARLILPGQSSITPDASKSSGPPASNATADNWLDFSVPASVSVVTDQLILRLGKVDEAQMDIPLKSGANLSAYQDKTVTPSASQVTYDGLKYTVTKATETYSADTKQAAKGHRFVTISFTIDNPGSTNVYNSPSDYLRMKAGGETNTPENDTTVPGSFDAGSSGSTGYASFAVPENATTFTLLFLATGGVKQQASIDFKLS